MLTYSLVGLMISVFFFTSASFVLVCPRASARPALRSLLSHSAFSNSSAFALAIAAVIGVFMFFDAGHPVRVSVVGYEVLSAGSEPESTRDCEFRLEFSSAYERNVVLLLVHARGGEGLVTRLFPAPLQAGREQASPSGVSNPIGAVDGLRVPASPRRPFRYPCEAGMGVLVVSSSSDQELSEVVIDGLLETSRVLLAEGALDSATCRRIVRGLTESAQHDSVDAHVHWVELPAPPK